MWWTWWSRRGPMRPWASTPASGVAGDEQEVLAFVQRLNDALRAGGFHPRFDLLEE